MTFLISWLNVLDQHYGDSVSPGPPIYENGEIDQHLLEQVQWEKVDCLWRGSVSGGHYLVHNPNLLGNPMHLTMETLKIWNLAIACQRAASI